MAGSIMRGFGRVAIGTRLGGGAAAAGFFDAWTGLTFAGTRDGDVVLSCAARMPAHRAMNKLIDAFLKTDADTLLTIDDDHVFRPDTLERLRSRPESWGYDVLGALYLVRGIQPARPCILRYADDCEARDFRTGDVTYTWPESWPPGDIIECDACGFGFTLIRRRVFEAIPAPWTWYPSASDTASEDVTLWADARRAGFRIAVDTAVTVVHVVGDAIAEPGPLYEQAVAKRAHTIIYESEAQNGRKRGPRRRR